MQIYKYIYNILYLRQNIFLIIIDRGANKAPLRTIYLFSGPAVN